MAIKIYYKGKSEHGKMFEVDENFEIGKSHFLVAEVDDSLDAEEIFHKFNMDFPVGFIDNINSIKEVYHTSMSVGDVIVKENGTTLACDNIGWKRINT